MKILLAIDGSDASTTAVQAVEALDLPAGAEVTLLTVVPDANWSYGSWPAMEMVALNDVNRESTTDAHRRLAAIAPRLRADGRSVRSVVRHGRVATEILEEAERIGAALIVVGARGVGAVERLLIGSVSSEVVDRAHCPVLVVRTASMQRVLVATDGSADGDCAAEFVRASGLFRDPMLKVLSVIDTGGPWWAGFAPDAYEAACEAAERHAAETARTTGERLGAEHVVSASRVRGGEVGSTILEEAADWGADVIVLGTRGHGLLHRSLVGSTSRRVLHHAPMSVLVVRRPAATGINKRNQAA
jgi:nucleotide-binding universal stress UspA family protein